MKPAFLVLGLGALGLGIGAVALGFGGEAAAPSDSASAARLASLEKQVDAVRSLANVVAQLEARLDLVESTALHAARTPALPPPVPAAAMEVAAAPSGDAIPVLPVVDDRLRVAVARVLQEERETAERAEQERREQRRQDQINRRLDRLATELGLNDQQKEELGRLVAEDEERRQGLRERFERGEVDWADQGFREEMNEYMAVRDERLATFLTPEQLEKYRQSPEGRVVGFMRRGFGGFGGGDGGMDPLRGGRRRDQAPR